MNKEMGEQLSRPYPFVLKTYNVVLNNGCLIAEEYNNIKPIVKHNWDLRELHEKSFYFDNYIKSLHNNFVKNYDVRKINNTGYVSFDGDYLVIVENGSYRITKNVFDLRNVELPQSMIKQIEEIKEYSLLDEKENMISKYAPIVEGVTQHDLVHPTNKEELDKLIEFYKKSCGYIYDKHNPRSNFDLIPPYIIYAFAIINFPQLNELYKNHRFIWLAAFVAYVVGGGYVSGKIGKQIANRKLDKEMEKYKELSLRISNGDLTAIRELSADIASIAHELKLYGNQVINTIGRDLTILDCYSDESFLPIRQELLTLGCEYLEYRSYSEDNDLMENLFLNKLKSIEYKIELADKKLAFSDEDTRDILSNNIDYDENNQLRLVPIKYSQEGTIKM